ncbi:hypothetical protein PDIP_76460 [Penicillium digitatum Pd1]|uniref:Uncharacterized protein n=1 Tax=Penicillium digitatum (strain Pd1 / CECT 20795) TaxID=1170230 RepID=K9FBS7_PEND1|nr:hypothetical protein PDIP_76460 [Penicillium digitatum Pd1]EKV06825.1 hypothetical protein PDIP_76460 [Penicillium digitatum Pd1]
MSFERSFFETSFPFLASEQEGSRRNTSSIGAEEDAKCAI